MMSSTVVKTVLPKYEVSFTAIFEGVKGFAPNIYNPAPVLKLNELKWLFEAAPLMDLRYSSGHTSAVVCCLSYLGDELLRAGASVSILVGGEPKFRSEHMVQDFTKGSKITSSTWIHVNSGTHIGSQISLSMALEPGGDTLSFRVDLVIYKEKLVDNNNTISSLSQDLGAYLSGTNYDDVLSDFVLIARDGEQVRTHRLLLCARSEVFRAMLTSRMSEDRSGEVQIEDFDVDVVRLFCKYLSSDCVSVDQLSLHCEALFKMAHRYHFNSLMTVCVRHLFSTLSVDNVVSRLVLADWYALHMLKSRALTFIVSHARAVVCTVDEETKKTGAGAGTNLAEQLSTGLCQEVMVALVEGRG